MFRLSGGLQRALRHWPTGRTLTGLTVRRKSKLIPVGLRFVVRYAQTAPDNFRSFSTSLSVMNEDPFHACLGAGTLDDAVSWQHVRGLCLNTNLTSLARPSDYAVEKWVIFDKRNTIVQCVYPTTPESSDVQNVILALPEVARIPPRKRTFHINQEDLDTLVRPLLSYHWHVGRVGDDLDNLQVFSLNKLFNFKDFHSSVEFFDALAAIQEEENHHARVTVDYSNVYVSTHTHVAYQSASDTDTESKPIKVPGLTARDIRFAVKVETLHEKFLGDGRAVTKVPVDSTGLQAWSMEQLRRRYLVSHG